MTTLCLDDVGRTYPGEVPVLALAGVSLHVTQGEYLAIEGPSGSGKSTLLNQIGLLDTPTTGQYTIDGQDTTDLSDAARARLRSQTIAFIFQSFHLLDSRTVLDNVALGTLYRGLPQRRRRELAHEALEFVGLAHKEWQRASRLSGGERQRIAIARAIASGAPVVLADEPTGNLDRATGTQVMDTLERLNKRGTTLIVVTHDPDVATRAHRRLHVLDGHVTETTQPTSPTPSADTAVLATEPPAPEGRPSRLRPPDGLIDAWRGLWSKRSRAAALIASVTLGVGLALTTAGLSTTAQAQVSGLFDAQRNQRVALTSPALTEDANNVAVTQAVSEDSLTRLDDIAGVQGALVAANHGQVVASTTPTSLELARSQGATPHDLLGLVAGRVPAGLLTVDTQGASLTALGDRDVLVGSQTAADLNLGPLQAEPVIWIDGEPHRVVGIITEAGLQVGLLSSLVVSEKDAAALAPIQWATADLRVQPGAAAQVAGQAPVAWIPSQPGQVAVDAPPDPRGLRDTIETNVATMLMTLTGVTLLAAVLSLTNAMTTAVYERAGEFGLRRAIGGRRVHVTALVLVESLIVGLVGGILGAYTSVLAILAVTLARGWQPVLDPRLLPLGLAGGILVGMLGGALATWRASRIEPSDALRA
ncbi:ATP-binding cassette domain-containing protein [Actinomyces radicidentis]|uniref:ABC transporter ATP-binding protein/permease n=1 Tax=Actinomyces radicidentis TaxID=111015 RepID=UPI000A0248E3